MKRKKPDELDQYQKWLHKRMADCRNYMSDYEYTQLITFRYCAAAYNAFKRRKKGKRK